MLFSTLVPTLLHFAVAMFSVGAWLPGHLRRWIHDHLDDQDAATAVGVPLAIGACWTACLALPTLAVWGLWSGVTRAFFPYPFAWYLDVIQRVADWATLWLGPLA